MNRAYGLSVTVAALAMSCASSSSPTSATTGTWSAIYATIFPRETKAQCSFCHSLPPNEKSNGQFSVGADKDSAYQAVVGRASTSAKCSGRSLVVPGKPDESLLLLKVTASPCGDLMPLGGSPLTDDQVEMIRGWIAAGAKDD